MVRWRNLACAGTLLLAVACATDKRPADAAPDASVANPVSSDRIPVTIDGPNGPIVFSSEVADSPPERQMGLMHRTSMGDDEGMLFLFPTEGPRSFWMRNTLIPLDMIFIKADRTILGIVENATPRTDTSRGVPGTSQFVLEINGGLSAKLGLQGGQTVSFYAPLPSL